MKVGLLLSGGMDSVSLAWWKRPDLAVTIDYGQKAAEAEVLAAGQVCRDLQIEHVVVSIDCSSLGSGDLSSSPPSSLAPASDWWPYRNQLLITLACMRSISRDVGTMMIGAVKSDGDCHRDGSFEFVENIDQLMASQEGNMRIVAPAIDLTTPELVRLAAVPAGLLGWAHSCHKANVACGNCRGCNKYFETLQVLGEPYAPYR